MESQPGRKYGWGKVNRLRKHAQFCRVQSRGRRIGGKFLLVIFAPSSYLSVRFGLTVSKRVGNAVVRNKIKRRLRDILRHHKASLDGLDIVCIARPEASGASYSELERDVITQLERIPKERPCHRSSNAQQQA